MSRRDYNDQKKKILLGKNILRRVFSKPCHPRPHSGHRSTHFSSFPPLCAKSKVNQDWKELAKDSIYLIAERFWKVFEGKQEFTRTEAVKQGAYESLDLAAI